MWGVMVICRVNFSGSLMPSHASEMDDAYATVLRTPAVAP